MGGATFGKGGMGVRGKRSWGIVQEQRYRGKPQTGLIGQVDGGWGFTLEHEVQPQNETQLLKKPSLTAWIKVKV